MRILLLIILFPSLMAGGQSKLEQKTAEMAQKMKCLQATEENPVTLDAQLVMEGDSLAILVKAAMAPGWHIYAYVPPSDPYIVIDPILNLPDGINAVGSWKKPSPYSSADDPGVLIYEGEAVFIHKAFRHSKGGEGVIKAGLYYQTCNIRQCLPPKEETFMLKF